MTQVSLPDRALGVALGLVLDRLLGEPPDVLHPVAWFGTAMGRAERALYADARLPGAVYALTGVALGAGSGLALQRLGRTLPGGRAGCEGREPCGRSVVLPVATAVAVAGAGRMLRDTAARIEQRLVEGDLEGARELLPWLVGRDPSGLDTGGVSAAVVESLAENTVDAVVAPAFWGLVAGAPGVLTHRAVNTMDAMVGHRSERYARFGTASARLDDVMAWLPARVLAGLVAVLAAAGPKVVLRTVRRDAPAHPSPNSGVAESAVAAALGVELGGPVRYGTREEDRPRLGQGPRPDASTITLARRLVDRVEVAAAAACVVLAAAVRHDAGRRRRRTRRARPDLTRESTR